MILKTEYFVSPGKPSSELHLAILEAKKLRDNFIKSNENDISVIQTENMQIVRYSPHNNNLFVIITLSYFPKI